MKCIGCGAIVSASNVSCEFCGASYASKSPDVADAARPEGARTTREISEFEDALNLIKELGDTPSKGFKWWALFFPIAYLFGFGSKANAIKVSLVILAPVAALSIGAYFFTDALYQVLDLVIAGWTIYLSYLVASRSHALVKEGSTFDIGRGLVGQLVYLVVYFIIVSI